MERRRFEALIQTAAAVLVLLVSAGTGYYIRHNEILNNAKNSVTLAQTQGDDSSSVLPGPQQGTANPTAQITSRNATSPAPSIQSTTSPVKMTTLGDLSTFITIEQDTLNMVNNGDLSSATKRVDDLEYQ